MNIFAVLLGGFAVKQITDYPSEIKKLKNQLPKEDRDAFLDQYKHLANSDKKSFKQALRDADIKAASKILGQDLTKYNVVLKKQPVSDYQPIEGNPEVNGAPPKSDPASGTDIINKVNRLLAVPTSIDPELVAEAARRYEEAVPSSSNASITERTQRLLEVSG